MGLCKQKLEKLHKTKDYTHLSNLLFGNEDIADDFVEFDPLSSPSINPCCTRVVIQVLVGYITMKRFIGKYELGTVS